MLGKPMVILNSFKACRELLEKRSAKYSDRPPFVMSCELAGWEFNFALMGYSHRWRHHRRLFHLHFHENMATSYQHIQERCAHALLRRCLETPKQVQDHIRLLFGETILEVVYGIAPKGPHDSFIKNAEDAVYAFSQAGEPGRWLVDAFPLLKYVPSWMPGAGFRRKASEWSETVVASRNRPAEHVQKSIEDGTARPSVLASLLTNCDIDQDQETKDDMEFVAPSDPDESPQDAAISSCGIAYVAGADTSVSTMQTFVLAMANYVGCQKEAQAELDAVIGKSRLPTFEDLDDLPYVVAITKEILRWHVVIPLCIPHALTEDDEYNGYFLPKGSVVIPNSWLLLHDPEMYPDPSAFKPERWLMDTPEGRKLNPNVVDPEAAFGYGRRICPGRHFARATIFIAVASILATYDIRPVDESNRPVERLDEGVTDGLLSYPLPYNVSVVPRSERAAQMIKDTANLHA